MHGWIVPPWARAALCLCLWSQRTGGCWGGGWGVYAVAAQAMMLAMMERYFILRFEGDGLVCDWAESGFAVEG